MVGKVESVLWLVLMAAMIRMTRKRKRKRKRMSMTKLLEMRKILKVILKSLLSSTSAKFSTPGRSGTRLMLVNEVALGNTKV